MIRMIANSLILTWNKSQDLSHLEVPNPCPLILHFFFSRESSSSCIPLPKAGCRATCPISLCFYKENAALRYQQDTPVLMVNWGAPKSSKYMQAMSPQPTVFNCIKLTDPKEHFLIPPPFPVVSLNLTSKIHTWGFNKHNKWLTITHFNSWAKWFLGYFSASHKKGPPKY